MGDTLDETERYCISMQEKAALLVNNEGWLALKEQFTSEMESLMQRALGATSAHEMAKYLGASSALRGVVEWPENTIRTSRERIEQIERTRQSFVEAQTRRPRGV